MTNKPSTRLSPINILSVVFFSSVVAVSAKAGGAASWIQTVGTSNVSVMNSFKIRAVEEQAGHLIGIATYRDKLGHPPLNVRGIQTSDGRFWPNLTAEIANDTSGEWKTLNYVSPHGSSTTVSLRFYEANITLYINLDVFRPLVGKVRYGKIALANGEAALFDLKDLAKDTAEETKTEDWDRVISSGYLENPLAKAPFAISGIASKNGHLRAECIYNDPKQATPTMIEGTETPDGNFWPYGILQVANDPDGEWKTVGQTRNKGRAVTVSFRSDKPERIIYADLDPLRLMLGKFGYGRIVLKNRESAAFELADLLPPKSSY